MTDNPNVEANTQCPAPTGEVTLMFTDMEGSTQLWERLDKDFQPVLEDHNRIVRTALIEWRGYEVKTEGDAFMAAFSSAADSVCCAIEIQRELARHPWPATVGTIRIRIGMHTGEPLVTCSPTGHTDYFGPMVNRAARISAAGHGGQIVISQAVNDSAQGLLPDALEIIDLNTHQLKGLERPEVLFQVYHPDLELRDFPPLRTMDRVPHNLPIQTTSFVGRQKELGQIVELLRDPATRLVTLLGPGGVGKTRLSLQAASEVADIFPDGVWFVELEEVREKEGVPAAIADALRIPPQPGQTPAAQLLSVLPQRNLLLVCDNFEQVTQGATFLSDLMRAAPKVRMISSSRIPLRLRGERVYEVSPMPQPSEDTSLEDLTNYDSVALFAARAQAAKAGWALTPENASAVAELCRRLEGMPLCIELAAARVRGMMPQEILKGLSDRFRLLSSRSSDLPERQRTLRGAIDWSYELLTEEERRFFACLSVFRGGFFGDAAEAVTEDDFALDVVLDLQAHSLVVAQEMGERMRYSMLDQMREYARDKLKEDAGEAETMLSRHAAHYCDLAERCATHFRTPQDAQAMGELSGELDNLRAALEWSHASDSALCARLAALLRRFFERRALWDDALLWAERGLESARKAGDERLEATLLLNLASAHQDRGNYGQAREGAAESLEMWQRLGDRAGEADALNLLGLIAGDEDDLARAEELHSRALALRREAKDRVGEAMSLHNLGLVAYRKDDTALAERCYAEAIALRRSIGDRRGVAETLCNLGVLAQDRQEYSDASRSYRECLEIWMELGDRVGMALPLNNIGEVAAAEGNLDRALPMLAAAEETFRRFGSPMAAGPEQTIKSLAENADYESFRARLEAARKVTWHAAIKMAMEK